VSEVPGRTAVKADVVLFDFGGTLDADGVHWSPRLYSAYRAAGGSLDYASFDPLVQATDRALAQLPEIRRLGFRDTVEAEVRVLLELVPERLRVDARRMSERFYGEARAAVERNQPVLLRLARRYRLGIVSNFWGNLAPCLEELGLAGLFAAVSDSGVIGAAKPDPRIFAETLRALEAAAEQAWMVGDNFEADIRAAAGLGMRTCWVAPQDRTAPAGVVPTARIARLPDIEGVLE
jgi:HAD superfamily hydrolase (TIGR01549 family)